jgi:hypothetical protein
MALVLGAVLGVAGCSSSGTSSGGKAPLGPPQGTVTVRSGNKVVCVITLDKNGTGTCKVGTAGYTPGKVTFTGTYNGGSGFKSGSASTTLTVLPAKPAGPVASSAGPGST